MPPPSPTDASNGTLSIIIKVDGAAIKDTYGISSVNVTSAINRIPVAEIVLRAEVDIDSGALPLSDGSDFQPGKEVEITAGYTGSSSTSIFKGIIVKHGVDIDDVNGYSFKITCKHKAVLMTFAEKEACFLQMKDSDIIQKIIGTYGITKTVTATTAEQEFVFQRMSTDWDFIVARAEFNGFIVVPGVAADLKIIKPVLSGTAVLSVKIGTSIISFSAELNAEDQPSTIEAHAWDPKTQAMLTSTAAEPSVNAQGSLNGKAMGNALSQSTLKLVSPTSIDAGGLQSWANGILLRKRLAALKGTVKFVGSGLAVPGCLIDLESVGGKFNGSAFVSSVTHSIDNTDGWSTTVKIGLENSLTNRKPGFSYSPAGGQLPAIHGLQIGRVKKLSADPASENRIQVTLASNATNPDVWARFANFYATSDAGSGFLPEVNDEVVVGFLDADPRYAVVLGSLYSSKNKSPNVPPDENNYIKSITTKAKLKITMDDEKKSIKIETPGGNMITFSDDAKSIEIVDQNSNSIKMTSSGINLESAKDITIKATGGITLNATKAVAISSSGGDVKLDGLNIAATAQMGLTAKGNATAEISASGQTTVKGGIVMIN